jgi:hypothetical protein
LIRWLRSRREVPPSDAVRVWNRACDYDFQPTLSGDRSLKSAIQFDGLTGNGGLGHALDVLTDEDVGEAVKSFRYLGLQDTAQLIEQAFALPDEGMREALTERYYELTEDALESAFERHYAEYPPEYEPVELKSAE